jgi:hypothetical protein
LGPLLKKKRELGGTRFINKANFTNVCLGRLEWYKFSQDSNVASSSKWKNDAPSRLSSHRGLVV